MSKNVKNISVKRLLRWLWSNSKGVRRQAAANTAIGLLDVVCQLLWVLACKHAIDIATGVKEGELTTTGFVIAALMLVQFLSSYGRCTDHTIIPLSAICFCIEAKVWLTCSSV